MAKKKYIGKNVVDLESKFREDVYLEKLTSTTDTKVLVVGDNGKVSFNTTGVGDKTYVHYQNTASDTWVVQHNLGKYPAVQIIDSAGTFTVGQVVHDTINQLTLTFNGSFSGTAYLN